MKAKDLKAFISAVPDDADIQIGKGYQYADWDDLRPELLRAVMVPAVEGSKVAKVEA